MCNYKHQACLLQEIAEVVILGYFVQGGLE